MNTVTLQQREKTAQLVWTAFILMFFVIQAIIWTFAISIISNDASHAVVANYNEQALKWDETKLSRQASAALGWEVQTIVDPSADIRGNRTLKLQLTHQSKPVENARVVLTAFHRGRAGDPQHIDLMESSPGVYVGTVQVQHIGDWQFSGTATIDDDQFLIEQRIAISN